MIPPPLTGLQPEERVLWQGQPKQGFRLRPKDALVIPFSLVWCGFVLFWNVTVTKSGAPLMMRFFGIPFLAIGFYMVFGRFIVDLFQRKKTWYFLTDQRAIIVSGLFSRIERSIDIASTQDISIEGRADGSGTIRFGRSQVEPSFGMRWGNQVQEAPSFEMIADAAMIYRMIMQVKKGGEIR